jgi:L-ribulose-5-phosphate 4-epimerase
MSIDIYLSGLVDACRKLPELGLATGSTGNISARDPKSGKIGIKCSGVAYETMTEDDLAVLDIDGNILAMKSDRRPSIEAPTHLWIYRNHPEVNAIQHSHLKYAIILSSFYSEIPVAITPTSLRLLGSPVPVVEFVQNGSQEMAETLSPYFDENVALIIKNHGVFTIGDSIDGAFARTVALDDLTFIYYHMVLLGKPTSIGM